MTKIFDRLMPYNFSLRSTGRRERRPLPAGELGKFLQDERFTKLTDRLKTDEESRLTQKIIDSLPVFPYPENTAMPLEMKRSLFMQSLLSTEILLQEFGFTEPEIAQSYLDSHEGLFRANEQRLQVTKNFIVAVVEAKKEKSYPTSTFSANPNNQKRVSFIRQATVYDIVSQLPTATTSVEELLAKLPPDAFLPNTNTTQKIQAIRDTIKTLVDWKVIRHSPVTLPPRERRTIVRREINRGAMRGQRISTKELQEITGASRSTIEEDIKQLRERGRILRELAKKGLTPETINLLDTLKRIVDKYPNEGGRRTISDKELLENVNAIEGFEQVNINQLTYALKRYGRKFDIPPRVTGKLKDRVRELLTTDANMSNAEIVKKLQEEGFDTDQKRVAVTVANLNRIRRKPRTS